MAQQFSVRPSSLLNLSDPYEAYCLDEAAAWLLAQKEPSDYGNKSRINGNSKLMAALEKTGGVKIIGAKKP